MWAAVLSKVLKAYLSEIVEDTGDLNVALRKGKVVLNNVIVKENLLEWTGLPLKVAKGSRIGKLEINFLNLRNLSAGGKPVLVNIENINATKISIDLCNKFGILVKDCSGKKSFGKSNCIRVAVRDTRDNEYLLDCLKTFEV